MILNTINEILDFMRDIEDDYRAEIKGENLSAITRYRKVTPLPLLLQMFGQIGKTQHAELLDFYKDIDRPVKHDDSMVKLNDYLVTVTALNSSFPQPKKTKSISEGFSSRATPEHLPVMGMMSTLYNCVNKMVLIYRLMNFFIEKKKMMKGNQKS